MKSAPLVGLLGLAVLLGGVLFREFAGTAAPAALHRSAPLAAAPATAASGLGAAPENTPRLVDAILARPLFEASRRPPSSAPGATVTAAVAFLPRLAGIIISPATRYVIFAGVGNGKPLVLAEGDRVDGYLIESIGPDGVIVRSRDGSHVLRPSFDLNAPKTAPARLTPPAVAAPLGVPAPSPATAAVPLVPGLRGRPLGLPASARDAAPTEASFPSLAAPAAPPQTPATDQR